MGALAAGLIRSLMYLPEFVATPVNIQMQLQHILTLFHSIVATNNLKAALEFKKLILLMGERGQLRWEPEFSPLLQLMQINYLASVRVSPGNFSTQYDSTTKFSKQKSDTKPAPRDSDGGKRFKDAKETFCMAFQDGACPHLATHESKQHFCCFCWGMRSQKLSHVAVQMIPVND